MESTIQNTEYYMKSFLVRKCRESDLLLQLFGDNLAYELRFFVEWAEWNAIQR